MYHYLLMLQQSKAEQKPQPSPVQGRFSHRCHYRFEQMALQLMEAGGRVEKSGLPGPFP